MLAYKEKLCSRISLYFSRPINLLIISIITNLKGLTVPFEVFQRQSRRCIFHMVENWSNTSCKSCRCEGKRLFCLSCCYTLSFDIKRTNNGKLEAFFFCLETFSWYVNNFFRLVVLAQENEIAICRVLENILKKRKVFNPFFEGVGLIKIYHFWTRSAKEFDLEYVSEAQYFLVSLSVLEGAARKNFSTFRHASTEKHLQYWP